MNRIEIALTDDMTMGALRKLAGLMGKNLSVTLDAAPRAAAKVPARRKATIKKRRRLSAALRATLVANAAKARAALARKRAAAATV